MDNMVLNLADKHNYQDANERSVQTAIPDNKDLKNSMLVFLLVMNRQQSIPLTKEYIFYLLAYTK